MRHVFILAALFSSTAYGADLTLSTSGSCPGVMTFTVDGLAPGASYGLLSANGPGSATMPGGPCPGVATGLSPSGFAFRGVHSGVIAPTIPGAACPAYVQALDPDTCTLSPAVPIVSDMPATCREVGGVLWCFHPDECGVACNDTCDAFGMTPMADSAAWLAVQDTAGECEELAAAFDNFEPVSMGGWTHACLEDSSGDHAPGGGPLGSFYCSTYAGCPDSHLTNMDGLGTPCGAGSRLSICPCE
jgi:hypothetical protein